MLCSGFSWAAIEAEIEKCEVRCGNCHRRRTAREQGIYELKSGLAQPHAASGSFVRDNQGVMGR
jgi:hypothetical protein